MWSSFCNSSSCFTSIGFTDWLNVSLYCMHLGANYVLLWKFFLSLAVFYLLPQQLKKKRVMSPEMEVCDDLLNYSACIKAGGKLCVMGEQSRRWVGLLCPYTCVCVYAAYQSRSSCTLYGCQQTVGLCNPGDRQLLCVRRCRLVPLPDLQYTHCRL